MVKVIEGYVCDMSAAREVGQWSGGYQVGFETLYHNDELGYYFLYGNTDALREFAKDVDFFDRTDCDFVILEEPQAADWVGRRLGFDAHLQEFKGHWLVRDRALASDER